jgi:chromosome segregation ATPase
MKQLSEQDRQRIENDSITHKEYKTLELLYAYSEHRRWKNGYTTGATAERLLAESEKEDLRKKWDCDKAALNEAVRKCNHYESEKEELRKDYHDLQTDLARSNSKQIDLQSELSRLEAERERVINVINTGMMTHERKYERILSILNQKE